MNSRHDSPNAYLSALSGWQQVRAGALRQAVIEAARLEERIKWGHLVYFSGGPVLLIRAEEHRVLFGFWRGKRLLDIEPRLTGNGKYELRTLDLREDTAIDAAVAERLIREAVRLNLTVGNPTERN